MLKRRSKFTIDIDKLYDEVAEIINLDTSIIRSVVESLDTVVLDRVRSQGIIDGEHYREIKINYPIIGTISLVPRISIKQQDGYPELTPMLRAETSYLSNISDAYYKHRDFLDERTNSSVNNAMIEHYMTLIRKEDD